MSHLPWPPQPLHLQPLTTNPSAHHHEQCQGRHVAPQWWEGQHEVTPYRLITASYPNQALTLLLSTSSPFKPTLCSVSHYNTRKYAFPSWIRWQTSTIYWLSLDFGRSLHSPCIPCGSARTVCGICTDFWSPKWQEFMVFQSAQINTDPRRIVWTEQFFHGFCGIRPSASEDSAYLLLLLLLLIIIIIIIINY